MLKTLDLEEAAKEAAGNWRKFRCFVWWREREMNDADQWAIIYTDNRDSGLIDQSNAAVIRENDCHIKACTRVARNAAKNK